MVSTKKLFVRKGITLMDILALFEQLVNGLTGAESRFFENPKDFYSLEKDVKASTEAFAAGFLGNVLSEVNRYIRDSGWRKGRYNIQRTDSRMMITSVGDIHFDCTYFNRMFGEGGYAYLLEDLIGLSDHERFSEGAEAAILTEALKTSYQDAAGVLPSKQKITKTTVMNKVHQIAEEMPPVIPNELKKVDYLYIEADEDHIAEQHGDSGKDNKSFISKLICLYESKEPATGCESRKRLVDSFYFSGLYSGTEGNKKLWSNVQEYINASYDAEHIKRIFISGDGAPWIKGGADYIDKALFCADKYHLMKYINSAAAQMLDEKETAKEELWHILYSKKPKAKERFAAYMERMMKSANNPDKVENLRSYVLGNWAAVRRTLRNKLVNGCSAEAHVSHVLSDRMSSRPMGWSQCGADRMSKRRCYERNYGREGIIDLVRYSREQRKLKTTGTEDVPVSAVSLREIRAEHYDKARSYLERIQAHIPGMTARKMASIRTGLNDL